MENFQPGSPTNFRTQPEEQSPIIEPDHRPDGHPLINFIKGLMTFLVLLAVVAGSFWFSFQLGRKILTPTKSLNERAKIQVPIPEPPPSIKSLQQLGYNISAEATLPKKANQQPKKLTIKEPPKAPIIKKVQPVILETVNTVQPKAGYFKLQAGLFVDKGQADSLRNQLKSAGIDAFVKKTADGWRVQAGAYLKKEQAERAQTEIGAKGFKAHVIHE
ncbi:hypothetical protein A2311_02310 [candidate division WOR-1 bacterium RIFOXYB2_FULL_48_7]|uniref:SPOR domain-containing protein n=1 Tax=candidate division WOR-1 bacterium RIFOXYB2_FULL_48_7 TaxID=1802583 RepID=A0A1F4TLD4_UNCSA|nr:MAG: hypothetical protein A2311_02310 [candidate division WOR-1 bacterium RIFOXYB2_FULL_48_7]